MKKQKITIAVDDDLLALIDEARGGVPRAVWCRNALNNEATLDTTSGPTVLTTFCDASKEGSVKWVQPMGRKMWPGKR